MNKNVNISRGLQYIHICFPDSIGWSIFKMFSFHVNVQETEVQNMKFELDVLKRKNSHRNCHDFVSYNAAFLCKMSQKKTSSIYLFLSK